MHAQKAVDRRLGSNLVFEASHHRPLRASRDLTVSREVTERYQHKGRDHLVITFEVRDKLTGQIYTTYRDTSLIGYRPYA